MYRMRKMCRKMSKENHFINKDKQKQEGAAPEKKMRRGHSLRVILGNALALIKRDIRDYGLAMGIIAGYLFFCMKFLYSSCPVVMLTGFPCPGCGLTRAGFALLHFQFAEAFRIHPMIYPVAALVIAFLVCRYVLQKPTKFLLKYVVLVLIAMGILYIYRMVKYFPDQEPMTYYYGAVFRFL